MKTCPKCHNEYDGSACPSCGYRSQWGRWVVTVLIVLAAAAAVLSLVFVAGRYMPLVWRHVAPQQPEATPTVTEELTVTVTVPEGYTVCRTADLLEQKGVCSAEVFLDAVQNGDFSEYPFVPLISMTDEEGNPNGRGYRLEGYIFPDTYEFYKDISGEAAVRRFLDNFSRKYNDLQAALAQSSHTLDEAVTLASIVQWEAKKEEDMSRMARVLQNRLDSPDYPRLQCDVSTRYLREMESRGLPVDKDAYDTYVCRGLPVGAICNPGFAALSAAITPSDEEICAGCYFFVTDDADGMIYYSKTYAEHLKVCREHKIGSFAE